MTNSSFPTNYTKHTSNNPIQRLLINNFFSALLDLTESTSSKSILDVGCGEGFTLKKLKTSNPYHKLEGIEYSNKSINLGKKLFPDIIIRKGNIYDLPYKKNCFDLILCTEVLEHLHKPEKGLKEIIKVSKKYLLISVPNEPFFMLSNFLRGKNILRLGNDPGHINHWTTASIARLIKENGLTIEKIQTPFPWTLVLAKKQ
jgi:2-polyprenyl-3-methyl-5-hydroxy-6-metoxy-1,4-benzoquinol methylase